MIRHGTTVANEKNLYYGATDIGVSEKGKAELAELRIKGGYPDITGCTVYTSGMVRTAETLGILYPETEYDVNEDLREMNFGRFEMRAYEELREDPEYQIWITGDFMENICPDGESGNMHSERAVRAFWDIVHKTDGDVLIVSHSGTMAAIMHSLFPDEGENRWHWKCYGGTGYAIELDGVCVVGHFKIPKTDAEE